MILYCLILKPQWIEEICDIPAGKLSAETPRRFRLGVLTVGGKGADFRIRFSIKKYISKIE